MLYSHLQYIPFTALFSKSQKWVRISVIAVISNIVTVRKLATSTPLTMEKVANLQSRRSPRPRDLVCGCGVQRHHLILC